MVVAVWRARGEVCPGVFTSPETPRGPRAKQFFLAAGVAMVTGSVRRRPHHVYVRPRDWGCCQQQVSVCECVGLPEVQSVVTGWVHVVSLMSTRHTCSSEFTSVFLFIEWNVLVM